ncbi:MAG: ring-cleaving dioxygenase [Alicyclobacillus sp.]|nr:ring-cleaving dioxygenase [Alicyclobacillus sp.]
MARTEIRGIHHVTALAGDPQRNVDVYTGLLGLRLVKQTVNFDDPEVYHLYYGDELGRPGTIMTFFPFGEGPRGTPGAGQATAVAFSVPPSALDQWTARLRSRGWLLTAPERRFGETVVSFRDADGLAVELVGAARDARPGWGGGAVPTDRAIRGFHSVTLQVREPEPIVRVLTEVLGFRPVKAEDLTHGSADVQGLAQGWDEPENPVAARAGGTRRLRFEVGEGGPGATVDVVASPDGCYGRNAIGTIHHVAWRVADASEFPAWQAALREAGLVPTEVRDRKYFQSVYFREPGGVLFELATDPPGFTVDEPPSALGRSLQLPDWLEPYRDRLSRALPPLVVPEVTP